MRRRVDLELEQRTFRSPSPSSHPDDRQSLSQGASGPIHCTEDFDFLWSPPEPSRAEREIPIRNTASYRGGIVDAARHRHFTFESLLERDHLYIALDRRDVAEVVEQSPTVWFVGADGKPTDHTFDAFITLVGGRRLAIDVKPRSRVERSGIKVVHELIERQYGSTIADQYLVRTEDHLHPDDVWDARWKARAGRFPDPAADLAIKELLPFLLAWCSVGRVVAQVGMGGAGFNAAVRLIGSGVLEIRDRERISYDCLVRRARAPQASRVVGEERLAPS